MSLLRMMNHPSVPIIYRVQWHRSDSDVKTVFRFEASEEGSSTVVTVYQADKEDLSNLIGKDLPVAVEQVSATLEHCTVRTRDETAALNQVEAKSTIKGKEARDFLGICWAGRTICSQ